MTRPRIAGCVVICTLLIAVVLKVCDEAPMTISITPKSQ